MRQAIRAAVSRAIAIGLLFAVPVVAQPMSPPDLRSLEPPSSEGLVQSPCPPDVAALGCYELADGEGLLIVKGPPLPGWVLTDRAGLAHTLYNDGDGDGRVESVFVLTRGADGSVRSANHIDRDEDGVIDRIEYSGPAEGGYWLGFDTDADGQLDHQEYDTNGDGEVDHGQDLDALGRVVVDTVDRDGDGYTDTEWHYAYDPEGQRVSAERLEHGQLVESCVVRDCPAPYDDCATVCEPRTAAPEASMYTASLELGRPALDDPELRAAVQRVVRERRDALAACFQASPQPFEMRVTMSFTVTSTGELEAIALDDPILASDPGLLDCLRRVLSDAVVSGGAASQPVDYPLVVLWE